MGGTTESVMVVSCESSAIDLKPGLSSKFSAQEEMSARRAGMDRSFITCWFYLVEKVKYAT